MKAFEDWYEKVGIDLSDDCLQRLPKGLGMEVWKAALKWTKTQCAAGLEEDGSVRVCGWATIDRINEELEN